MFLALHPQPVVPMETQSAAVTGTSASLTVAKGMCYRVAVDQNTYVRLTNGASTAVVTDMLLFPGAIHLIANWDTISFLRQSVSGNISVTRIQNPM